MMNTPTPDTGSQHGWYSPTTLHHRSRALVSDVLPVCDSFGLLLAISIASSVHASLLNGPDIGRMTCRLAFLAAAIAPFLLYDGRFGELASRTAWRPLLNSQAGRFTLCGAALMVLTLTSPELRSAPGDWLAIGLLLGFASIVVSRLLLRRAVRQAVVDEDAMEIAEGVDSRSRPDGTPSGAIRQPAQNQVVGTPHYTLSKVGTVLPVWLLADRPIKRWNAVIKASLDLVVSTLLTVALLPVLALTALAIKLESPGPVLFRQRRHTIDNREFDIFKFRTMQWRASGHDVELQQTARHDARVTRVGNVLRKSSLDELPQLLNVLRGEMSLVGPRPHAVNMRTENQLGHEVTEVYPHRHRMKPGITGWAQINGSRGATDTGAQLRRRIELDLHYIENWSLLLDLKILALTVREVVRQRNAY